MSYVPQLYTNKSLGNIALTNFGKPPVPYIPLPPFCANTLSPSFTFAPAIDSQGTRKEEVVGFAAKICDDCTKIVIETKYGVDEGGKDPIVITRNSHICFCPLKPSTLESAVRKLINISANLTELPWELKKVVKRWTGQDAYLVAFKLPLDKVKANIIDIYNSSRAIIDIYIPSRAKTNTNLRNSDNYPNQDNRRLHLWALRAIENGQIVLNDNDLIDFINIAKNKTWGYFRIHLDNPEDGANIDNSCSNSEIYCMFINRRRNAQKS